MSLKISNKFHPVAQAIIIFLAIFAGIILKLEKADTCFQVSIYVHPCYPLQQLHSTRSPCRFSVVKGDLPVYSYFRERSEKVHVAIPKVIVGGFEFTLLQRNLKEWHERPLMYICEC